MSGDVRFTYCRRSEPRKSGLGRRSTHQSRERNGTTGHTAARCTPPGTARQAGDISRGLSADQGIGGQLKSGTLLRSLAFTVGTDACTLTFDMTGLTGNASGDLATYNSDVAQLRQYCKA